MKSFLAVALLLVPWSIVNAYGDNFSCPIGRQGACLDYGDKVCSSRGKCVNENAECFDSFTCNYKGFICKAKFDDLADDCKKLADDHDTLVNEYNALLSRYKRLSSCLSLARTMKDVQTCAP